MLTEINQLSLLVVIFVINIIINYIYSNNIVFPILFSLFELFYGLSIIQLSEIFVTFFILFGIIYNLLITNERRKK